VSARRLWLPLLVAAAIPAVHFALKSMREPAPAGAPFVEPAMTAALAAPPAANPISLKRMSINAAEEADLVAIPGIGMKFAANILAARPPEGFADWDEVDRISGVGPARLRQLQERFTLP